MDMSTSWWLSITSLSGWKMLCIRHWRQSTWLDLLRIISFADMEYLTMSFQTMPCTLKTQSIKSLESTRLSTTSPFLTKHRQMVLLKQLKSVRIVNNSLYIEVCVIQYNGVPLYRRHMRMYKEREWCISNVLYKEREWCTSKNIHGLEPKASPMDY